MKALLKLAVYVATFMSFATAEEKSINLDGIFRAEQIIGHLGKPLGTVVRIKGKVRLEESPGTTDKKEVVARFLAISEIDGKSLDSPLELKLFSTSAPKALQGDVIEAMAYERIMTYGTPSGIPRPLIQAGIGVLDFHLNCYICLAEEERQDVWTPIKTSLIPANPIYASNDDQGWSINGKKCDINELISIISKSGERPVMLNLSKNASYGKNDLIYIAEGIDDGVQRRVFYHQARGNIDSMEVSFEYSPKE